MHVSTPGADDWLPSDGRRLPGHGRIDSEHDSLRGPRDGRPQDPRQYQMTKGFGSALVRPYAVTGGRTKPRYQLQIEAMVAASHYEARDLSALSPECQAIRGFCRDWRSVAESSALHMLPLRRAR